MVIEVLTHGHPPTLNGAEKLFRPDTRPAQLEIAEKTIAYPEALARMKSRAAAIATGDAEELVWFVEHPPLYTAGTSAQESDLLAPRQFPVYNAGRGGQYTYHGPGQRVAYVMLDLRERGRDIRCFVQGLEGWIIDTLARFNINGVRREGLIGVWVERPEKGIDRWDKIAAIGVRVSRWVSYHGIALNIAPDLSHYAGIVPCGVTDQGVTSFEDLGQLVSMEEVDSALISAFKDRLGPLSTD